MEEMKQNQSGYENDRLEDIYNRLLSIYNTTDSQKVLIEIGTLFRTIPDYRDSKKLAMACFVKAREFEKRDIYDKAMKHYEKGDITSLNIAISEFNKIPEYSDSENMIKECRAQIQVLKEERRRELFEMKKKKLHDKDNSDNDTFKMLFLGLSILTLIFVSVYFFSELF